MTEDEAAKLVLQTAWRDINRVVDRTVAGIRDGEGQPILDEAGRPARNPFTGQPMLSSAHPDVKPLAARLSAAGLAKDEEFMSDLAKVLKHCASAPIFSLYAALDGEGAFEGDIQIEMRVVDGPPLPTHLHEIFGQYDSGSKPSK